MKKLLFLLLLIPTLAWGQETMLARSNPYVLGAGTVAAAAPATPDFGAEVQRWKEIASASTTVITLTGAIPQGATVVIFANVQSQDTTLASVADSSSNSYSLGQHQDDATVAIAYAYVGTALEINDTITITWADPSYQYRHGAVFYLTDCASSGQTDGGTNATAYGTAISASANTTAANTVLIGAVSITQSFTYGSSSWTVSGAAHDNDGVQRVYYFYKVVSSAGAQDPGGTNSGDVTWYAIWNSFK